MAVHFYAFYMQGVLYTLISVSDSRHGHGGMVIVTGKAVRDREANAEPGTPPRLSFDGAELGGCVGGGWGSANYGAARRAPLPLDELTAHRVRERARLRSEE